MFRLITLLTVCFAAPALSASATRSRCWTSGNGQPAQWFEEGSVITRGKFYYECRRGELEPLGCFTDDQKKIPIGQTFQKDGYEFLCNLGQSGYVEFAYNGCIGSDGQTYQRGQTWTDPKNTYYFQCKEDGKVVKTITAGCLSHDKQRRVELGETDDFEGYTYKCTEKENGAVSLCSVGCIHDGQRFKIGEQWQDGDYVFYCKLQSGRCTKQCIGCLADGQKLYDGQRYRRDGTTFQCEIRAKTRRHRAVGCSVYENGVETNKVIGCRWFEQNADSKIEKTCESDGNKTKVNVVGCIYRHNGFDRIFLEPGKFTIWNLPREHRALGLACKATPDGAVLETFDVEAQAQATAGLKYDLPRGK